jgi:hypothetical protein
MTERAAEPTYGVEFSDGNKVSYYLGSDETLWDWADALVAVPFVDRLARIPLPDSYVVLDRAGARLVKGSPKLGITEILASESTAHDNKAYVLTCSMKSVSRSEFNAAGLSDERIIRSVAFGS